MTQKNIEIENALQTIDLLKQYAVAKTERNELLKQMDVIDGFANRLLTQKYITSNELIQKIEQAITLDKYRPKNMPITLFAINKGLNYINGDFSTFDSELSQMFKNKKNPNKIREQFKGGIANIQTLAKQFSADWIVRLNKHKKLADTARNTTPDKAVSTYNKLFKALTADFCKEYGCNINSKVITDWATSDIKPTTGWDYTNGYVIRLYRIKFSKTMSESEIKKQVAIFRKNPSKFPNARKKYAVRINITNIRKRHPESTDFFYKMISAFAHEMHHALDHEKPRAGALGPQIEFIDTKIYTPYEKNKKAYFASATETSSYEIEHELIKQLKSMNF